MTAEGDGTGQSSDPGNSGSRIERRSWVPDPGCQIVACVEVSDAQPDSAGSVRADVLRDLTTRRLERCIRPGDWLCLLGGNRVAVHFGNGGHRVPPSVLGSRLARAMGDHLVIGNDDVDVRVTVGISAGPADVDGCDVTASALAAVRATHRSTAGIDRPDETQASVTVAHVPADALHAPRRPVRRRADEGTEGEPGPLGSPGAPVRRIVRRVRVPLLHMAGITDVPGTHHPAESLRVAAGTVPRILIVDPAAPRGGTPRLAVEAVAAIARRLGVRPTIAPSSDPERVVLDLYVCEPHAVVVVLQSDTCRPVLMNGSPRAWENVPRLVRILANTGTPVIALAMGATAASVAACMDQGAIGLLDPDDLPNELANLVAASAVSSKSAGNGSNGNGDVPIDLSGRRLPAPFSALSGLTPSERKVLFHMMEGLAAAEIADCLVVSLPTVRSHIRSILRKLNVNSQLAAVAIANGTVRDSAILA